jgi:hypothetical protein
MDFNTVTITVSLNYALQIPHIKSTRHSRTFNWAILQMNWLPQTVPLITFRHRPRREHRSSVAVSLLRPRVLKFPRDRYSASPLACLWLSSYGCLSRLFRGLCLETNVVSEPFPSNSCFSALQGSWIEKICHTNLYPYGLYGLLVLSRTEFGTRQWVLILLNIFVSVTLLANPLHPCQGVLL